MMWRLLLLSWPLWAGGCIGSFCEDPHEIVSSSDSQPGALQIGIEFSTYGESIAALHDGRVVCLTCTAALILDQRLQVTGTTAASKPLMVAIAPSDAIYFVDRPEAKTALHHDLVASDPSGVVHWRAPLDCTADGPIAASTDGAYVECWRRGDGDSPTSQTVILAFDATTGESRQLPISQQSLLGPAQQGIFTLEQAQPQTGPVTLRRLDPSGNVRWSHTLTGTNDRLQVIRVAPTSDDGGIFVARSNGPVDLGDARADGTAGTMSSFVFELDATGATRWLFTAPVTYIGEIALTPDGQILLAGRTSTPAGSNGFLAIATPTGIVRMHTFDGTFSIGGLAVGADGRAWLETTVGSGEGDPPPILHIAGHTFSDTATYLFGIVP